jgi:hypothetical protein
MFSTPVVIVGFFSRTVSMCFRMIWNCSMIETPSGITGGGKSGDKLLPIQRLPLESSAMPRTLSPTVKVSVFDGSSAGNRITLSDWELLTQTRFCVSIDGDDDVWFGNFWGRGVGLMAGANPSGGAKTGDLIHVFQSGSIQMITDVGIDPAGNVWAANNWNVLDAVIAKDPADPISTKGGGQGVVVIFGVAAPVRTPLIGQVQQP